MAEIWNTGLVFCSYIYNYGLLSIQSFWNMEPGNCTVTFSRSKTMVLAWNYMIYSLKIPCKSICQNSKSGPEVILLILQTRGRHKTLKSRYPIPPGTPISELSPVPGTPWYPYFGTLAGTRYPLVPLFRNWARYPVPPGTPSSELSPVLPGNPISEPWPVPGTSWYPFFGTLAGTRYPLVPQFLNWARYPLVPLFRNQAWYPVI